MHLEHSFARCNNRAFLASSWWDFDSRHIAAPREFNVHPHNQPYQAMSNAPRKVKTISRDREEKRLDTHRPRPGSITESVHSHGKHFLFKPQCVGLVGMASLKGRLRIQPGICKDNSFRGQRSRSVFGPANPLIPVHNLLPGL